MSWWLISDIDPRAPKSEFMGELRIAPAEHRSSGRFHGCSMAKLDTLKPRIETINTSIAAPPPKTAEPFYTSSAWLELMASIKAERGERCEDCGRTGTRIFGDHIKELKDGGARLDRRNVRLRCGSCHTLKTNRERAKRMRG